MKSIKKLIRRLRARYNIFRYDNPEFSMIAALAATLTVLGILAAKVWFGV